MVSIDNLPRGARAKLQVQDPSKPIDLWVSAAKQQDVKMQTVNTRAARLGSLRTQLRTIHAMKTVWETENAAPEISSGEITETWKTPDKVLPVNQPWKLKWRHAVRADEVEDQVVHGFVNGLREEISRSGDTVTTKSGKLAPTYAGFIQRKNLLKTPAYKVGDRCYVMVRGIRALPNRFSYEIRNLQTGEVVSGTASDTGSFKKRVPVLANAEQQLELTIRRKTAHGGETVLTENLGRVTFAKKRQVDKGIAYQFVEPDGRRLDTFSANVKGMTVNEPNRRPLPKPTVKVSHKVLQGVPDRGRPTQFIKARAQTVLSLTNISVGTMVELLRQQLKDGSPVWKSIHKQVVKVGANSDGGHELVYDGATLSHTPLKVRVSRLTGRQYVLPVSMPEAGQAPAYGRFYAAEVIYKKNYSNWVRPGSVKRTVAYQVDGGQPMVRVYGRGTAPASAMVSIVAGSGKQQVESRPKRMRDAFATKIAAEPGTELFLKVKFADGTVEIQKLGIVPSAVGERYDNKLGPTGEPRFEPFTIDHFK